MTEDVYKTIEKPSHETLFKEKSSKFFDMLFPYLQRRMLKLFLKI